MLERCRNSICRPLELIFNGCPSNRIFPSDWKKGNTVPIHKENDKQRLNNYRPIPSLPICRKILEQLIVNEMFAFFIKNNLTSQHQSGFKPGGSRMDQLLSIAHDIY